MPFLCGFMFIVAFTQDELQFERNKAISIINATFFPPVINSPRTSSRAGLGFSSSGCHLLKVGSGPVASYHITRMFHRGPFALQSPHSPVPSPAQPRPVQPVFSDGNTSAALETLDSLSLDAQWVTGFTDGEGCFSISA